MEGHTIIQTVTYTLMLVVLVVIAAIDAKEKVINQRLLLVLFIGSFAAIYSNRDLSILGSVSASLITFTLLSLIHYISRKAIGFGDVKLCSCIAPYLGMQRMMSMFFAAMLICGLAALVLLAINKSNGKRELPFAPFAAVGTIIALVF